jgi:hypothetical protein
VCQGEHLSIMVWGERKERKTSPKGLFGLAGGTPGSSIQVTERDDL